jgi:peptide/nickel transport system ATP-binding protein
MPSAPSPEPTPALAAAPSGDVLRVEDLHISVHHGAATAVRGADLRVRAGETVGLVGESGSGKTLTCRAALGVLPPGCAVESGRVVFEGADVTAAGRKTWEAIHGSRIGAVFQDPASYLNPSLTVGQQLVEVLRVKVGLSRKAARARAVELLAAVGLRDPARVATQIPAELSGGMLQRVLIAIAISCDPALLIADEATTALDVTIQAEVIELLLGLRAERNMAILFVSHDLAVIAELCDRVVVFYAGEVVETGPTEEILRRPRHPYTQALLRVASVGDYGRRTLEVIDGQPPAVGTDLPGCRFAARCPFATEACTAAPVAARSVAPGHDLRCLRAEDPEVVAAAGTAAAVAGVAASGVAGGTATSGEQDDLVDA